MCPGVASLHDLYVWPMSTTEIALTCHLVMPAGHPGDAFIHDLCEELSHRFKISHATVQMEVDPHLSCALAPDSVV
jgi:cobalt-zinc-cadmium efflux system protein